MKSPAIGFDVTQRPEVTRSRGLAIWLVACAVALAIFVMPQAEVMGAATWAESASAPVEAEDEPADSLGDSADADATQESSGGRGRRGADSPGEVLVSLLMLGLFGLLFGVGCGAFGFGVNQVFRARSETTLRILCARPLLSFVAGFVITVVGLGLLSIFGSSDGLVLLILIAYFCGLVAIALGASIRLAAQWIEPGVGPDDSPTATAHIRGGLILVFMNAVVLLGSVLFFGILLGGVGAVLLSYFASIGGAAAAVAEPAEA